MTSGVNLIVAYDAKHDALVLLENFEGVAYGNYSFITYDGSTWRVVLESEREHVLEMGPL
jgi:hypothetical protein